MSIGKEELEAVIRVINSGNLSGYQGNFSDAFYGGPEIKALEKEWAEYFGIKHSIACNSATSGLWMACAAIGLKNDDECIVTPYSMTCSASIPLHFGVMPDFADIESDYFCLDPKSVEKQISKRTKAIIVVDLFGQPCDADAINEIAERKGKEYGHKIYVIEDAAQAVGAKYKGKYAGTLGDIGVFSLNVHKHIQCGEGGIAVTDDDNLAMKLRLSMNHAEAVANDVYMQGKEIEEIQYSIPRDSWSLVGMNLRMTELSAAIAREQLKKLGSILRVIRSYQDCLPIKVRPECEHAFYRYVTTENMLYVNTNIFNIKKHYITPIYQMPLFKSLGYDQHCCPTCESIEENIVLAWLKETP